MSTGRVEAFSDGVIAIIITIMVLELHIPHGTEISDLLQITPKFLAYLLSFAIVGIYWNNHHHLLKAAKEATPNIMWANLLLLFFLSLIPFFTGWLGEHYTASWPNALYGINLLMCAFSYQVLQKFIVTNNQQVEKNIGTDIKGLSSLAAYILAVIFAFVHPAISLILYAFVAIIWFIPDGRLAPAKR